MDVLTDIGNLIKTSRERLSLSQQEVADFVGVTKSAVSRWESGEVENIGRSKIKTLSEILKISPISIITGEIAESTPFRIQRVPVLGEVAAGVPIYAEENCTAYIEVDANHRIDFCLRVKGDSMIDARIQDGDIAFIRKQCDVENGEIAVVLINDEATLKRVYKNNSGIILKAENSKYQPTFYSEKDFADIRILGKLIFFQSKI